MDGTSSHGEPNPNVLLICVDDLRPELNCFGKSYIKSPNIDAIAAQGRVFKRHFVQAPTCGASRYAMLTGRYGPSGNRALFDRADKIKVDSNDVPPSMPAWFRQHGYTTVSVGKISHHPGGRGGKNWDDDAVKEMPNSWDRHLLPAGAWMHPRGWMHGLANGEIRHRPDGMDVVQSLEVEDASHPDGVAIVEAQKQLRTLSESGKPFFLAVGILKPHLPLGCPRKYLELYEDVALPEIPHRAKPTGRMTWHKSGEFMRYNRWGRDPNTDDVFAELVRRHYAACVSYADAQVGKLLRVLRSTNQADNTIIVLWGDHGWHLGEHAVWGKHTLFEESLRSPLIIAAPTMATPGQDTLAIVETIDVFPTLCELANLPRPKFSHGQSLTPCLTESLNVANWGRSNDSAVSYHLGHKTIRTKRHRLTIHQDGFVELYDHQSAFGETKNVAKRYPEWVSQLTDMLDARLSLK